ncbi:MAG: putative phosphoglycerate mutase [Myxococcota bacterium]|jgi:probable phosphoglycerate mutase
MIDHLTQVGDCNPPSWLQREGPGGDEHGEFTRSTAATAAAFSAGGPAAEQLGDLGLSLVPVNGGPTYALTRSEPATDRIGRWLARRHLCSRSVWLMRHGETWSNRSGLLSGARHGRQMGLLPGARAELTAHRLPPDSLVVHSDLQRSRESAAMLATDSCAPLFETPLLRELDFGAFEGRNIRNMCREDHAFRRLFLDGDAAASHHGAESLVHGVLRANRLFIQLDAALMEPRFSRVRSIVLVGHAVINRSIQILRDRAFDPSRGQFICEAGNETWPWMRNGETVSLDIARTNALQGIS